MDFSQFFSPNSWPGSMLPQNQPGAQQPGGPMNILPPVAQSQLSPVVNPDGTPVQQPGNPALSNAALAAGQSLMKGPGAPPPMQPINMVRPVGMGMLAGRGVF